MKNAIENKHLGSTLDDFLHDEGIYDEVRDLAIKKIISATFTEEMKKAGITKAEMARRMKTSRVSVDRLLDENNDAITLNTILKAAEAIGKPFQFSIEFAS
jgi:predicted XRE-type DNA-binding protein